MEIQPYCWFSIYKSVKLRRATDGIVEAVEYTGKQWVLGLQYHPEMMFENDKEQLKVFKYFVEKIKTL